MTQIPSGPQDRAWVLVRLFFLSFVLLIHPLPFDLRGWGLVIPAHSAQIAYVVFECLQTVVFAAAMFFGDMIPGMRWASACYRRLIAEMRVAPMGLKLRKLSPFILGCGLVTWFILKPVETVVSAVPPGSPRFLAATVYFIIERFMVIFVFVIQISSNDDDDEPGERRRSIARAAGRLLRPVRMRAATRVPVATT